MFKIEYLFCRLNIQIETIITKKKYNLNEEMVKCALGNMDIWFLAEQERQECCIFISDSLPNSNN